MNPPIVFGASYSVYTRIVCLVLKEKNIPYELQEIDVFSERGLPEDYVHRHPFARIPAFEYDGFCLYETGSISRYIDEVFPGAALMPDTIEGRARVNQIIGILDCYAYRSWVWDIYVEEDKDKRAQAIPQAEACISAIENLMTGEINFIGNDVTLADLYALPMMAYYLQTPEGQRSLDKYPRWVKWHESLSGRPSAALICP